MQCEVKATDEHTSSAAEISSYAAGAVNQKPEIQTAEFSAPITANGPAQLLYASLDPDGDSLTEDVFVDGQRRRSSGETNDTLASSNFVRGDVVECLYQVDDGHYSAGQLAKRRGSKRSTRCDRRQHKPRQPCPDDAVSCSYTYSDADGDPEDATTVEWSISGKKVSGYLDVADRAIFQWGLDLGLACAIDYAERDSWSAGEQTPLGRALPLGTYHDVALGWKDGCALPTADNAGVDCWGSTALIGAGKNSGNDAVGSSMGVASDSNSANLDDTSVIRRR